MLLTCAEKGLQNKFALPNYLSSKEVGQSKFVEYLLV